jgi:hypothetical protein
VQAGFGVLRQPRRTSVHGPALLILAGRADHSLKGLAKRLKMKKATGRVCGHVAPLPTGLRTPVLSGAPIRRSKNSPPALSCATTTAKLLTKDEGRDLREGSRLSQFNSRCWLGETSGPS